MIDHHKYVIASKKKWWRTTITNEMLIVISVIPGQGLQSKKIPILLLPGQIVQIAKTVSISLISLHS